MYRERERERENYHHVLQLSIVCLYYMLLCITAQFIVWFFSVWYCLCVSHGASGQGDRSETEVVGSQWKFTARIQHSVECHLRKSLAYKSLWVCWCLVTKHWFKNCTSCMVTSKELTFWSWGITISFHVLLILPAKSHTFLTHIKIVSLCNGQR